jgi:hypothetical protein
MPRQSNIGNIHGGRPLFLTEELIQYLAELKQLQNTTSKNRVGGYGVESEVKP